MGNFSEASLDKPAFFKKLDLVEKVFSHFILPDLENVVVVGAQHILPSTLEMLNSFFTRGLDPHNVFLIGKCYSTDENTYYKLMGLGVNVCFSSFEFKKNEPFDFYYRSNIQLFIEKILSSGILINKDRIIVLDDGGELISILNQKSVVNNLPFVCIEQTSSGFEKLKKIDLNISVINVARAPAKLLFESKIVAKTAIRELDNKIFIHSSLPRNVLLVGNGAIGSAVANALEGRCNVSTLDKNPDKSSASYKEILGSIPEFNLVIGCVGQPVLSNTIMNQLKMGTTLVSLSSSDREFNIINWRSLSSSIIDCHNDFEYKGIKILNCGFPLNFSGVADRVDIKEFELTRALLTLGILQAFEYGLKKGLVDLNHSIQSIIINEFSRKKGKVDIEQNCL